MPDRRRTHRPVSPAEIDAAAQITADDINRAAHAYRRNAPRALSTLLDAQPERPTPVEPPDASGQRGTL